MEGHYLLRVVIDISRDIKINAGCIHMLRKIFWALALSVPTIRNKSCLFPCLRNLSHNSVHIFDSLLLLIYYTFLAFKEAGNKVSAMQQL